MELLNNDNWMPWKRRMMAVLRDLDLDKYIEGDEEVPKPKDEGQPTEVEKKELKEWNRGDAKARTRIELAIGDAQMIHISGATTAKEMWNQLRKVKESKGKLGILATRRQLYRMTAEEGFDMLEHLTRLRKLQDELHMMNNKISDEDFTMIVLTSLPESWDLYTSAYFGQSNTLPSTTSHELISILLEEERRRKGRSGTNDIAMYFKGKGGGPPRKKDGEGKECFNCHKKGHLKRDCWAKGGGCEGKGPRGRGKTNHANQTRDTINDNLPDVSYMAQKLPTAFSEYDWILDSGATSHICTQKDAFTDYMPLENANVHGIGSQPVVALGKGTVTLVFTVNGQKIKHQLQDVLHLPGASNCLLAISRFDSRGGKVEFNGSHCTLKDSQGKTVGTGKQVNRLYLLSARAELPRREYANVAARHELTWDQWHRRLGHLSLSAVQALKRKNMVEGLTVDEANIPSISCEACIQAKQTRKGYPAEAEHRAKIPGERSMSDVWGPAATQAISGAKYYISFTDDNTRFVTVYGLKSKADAVNRIKEYTNIVNNKFDRKIKYLRFDNGKELVNEATQRWAVDNGIQIETTAPYSPSQNGVAERFNRTLMELARAMLIEKNLPLFLWEEAVLHAAYIRNRAPTRALEKETPYEAWNGEKPDISHLHEFGCKVWVLDESNTRTKLDPKSKAMIFVGYEDGPKAVRYYDPEKRSIKVSRNVVFSTEHKSEKATVNLPGLGVEGETVKDISNDTTSPSPPTPPENPIETPTARPRREKRKDHDYRHMNDPLARVYRKRDAPDPPDQDETAQFIAFLAQTLDTEWLPQTIEEALSSNEAADWKKAADEEMDQIHKMKTWELVDLPEGKKAIGSRWTFLRKRDEEGMIARYKGRLVAQGFSQKPGIDFDSEATFAPVMRFETLRAALALSTIYDWEINQMDVKNAYLHAYLHDEIYMRQPPGYDDGTGRVCKLLRSLYGLVRAANIWNQELDETLRELGFHSTRADSCCYIRKENDKFAMLLIWIDDITSFAKTKEENRMIEEGLRRKYEIKSMGKPSLLLGIKISRTHRQIALSQTHYINKIIERLGLQDTNPVYTPIDPNVDLDRAEEESGEKHGTDSGTYTMAIGSLMYVALATRPDISYAVNKLASYTSNPKSAHWTAVKRIFRYLKGSHTHQLTYNGTGQEKANVNMYTDADWGSSTDRKSTSGYVFVLAGGAISWSSKKQETVALSTAEAEYIAATHAAKQILWQRNLFNELEIDQPETSTLLTDNQAAISISHHPVSHARTKHIDIKFHFLRDLVKNNIIKTTYISTHDNLADLFTKGFPRVRHNDLTKWIGVLVGPGGVLERTAQP